MGTIINNDTLFGFPEAVWWIVAGVAIAVAIGYEIWRRNNLDD